MRSNTPLRQESIAWHCADLLREGRYSDVIQLLQPGVVGAETRQSLTAIHDILTERWATLLWHKLMKRALENGVTETELKGLITHVAFYAGWPCAVNAGRIAIEVFGEK